MDRVCILYRNLYCRLSLLWQQNIDEEFAVKHIRLMVVITYCCWAILGGCKNGMNQHTGESIEPGPELVSAAPKGPRPEKQPSGHHRPSSPPIPDLWDLRGHRDDVLLAKPLNVDSCVDEYFQERTSPIPQPQNAMLGAFVLRDSVRQEPWPPADKPSPAGVAKFSETVAVGLSVVPYVKQGEKVLIFIPNTLRENQGKFSHYVLYCPSNDSLHVPGFYYPSWLLEIVDRSKLEHKETIYTTLQSEKPAGGRYEVGPLFPFMEKYTKKNGMAHFIADLLAKRDLRFLDHIVGPRLKVRVKPQGFTEDIIKNSTPRLDINAYKPFVYPSEAQKTLVASFPDGMVESFGGSVREFFDKVKVSDCKITTKKIGKTWEMLCGAQKDDAQRKTFEVSIRGFKIFPKTLQHDNHLEIVEDDLTAIVHVDTRHEYWFKGQKVQGKLSVKYEDMGRGRKPLRFSIRPGVQPECEAEVSVTLAMVMNETPLQPASPCQDIRVHWPEAWGNPEVPGCDLQEAMRPGHLHCMVKPAQGTAARGPHTFELLWGPGWEPVMLEALPDRQEIRLTADHLRPRWPFKADDAWWGKPQPSEACAREPQYRIEAVTYKKGAGQEKHYNRPVDPTKLPSLQDIEWPSNQPLPDVIQLSLKQPETSLARQYRKEHSISWSLGSVSAPAPWTLKEKYQKDLQQGKVPLRLPLQPPDIPYSDDIEMHVFPDKAACIAQEKGLFISYYVKDEFFDASGKPKNREIDVCSAVKLIQRNVGAVSNCTQIEDEPSIGGPNIHFRKVLAQCKSDKKKLIVMSLSQDLDAVVGKTAIRESWIKVFEDIQDSSSSPAFALVAIQPGRNLRTLLRCEELASIPRETGAGSLRGKMSGLRFDARDLRAFEDLSLVSKEFGRRGLSVLYLTDNVGVLDDDPDKIPVTWLATLLDWDKNEVPLTVVTTKSCKPWGDTSWRKCIQWSGREQFSSLLRQFLSGEKGDKP